MEALAVAGLFGVTCVFAIVVAVITLRFLNVLQQIKRADSMDRSEWLREIDASHVAAFSNAMTALREVQGRVSDSQMDMFNRTMDMVHGPVAQANEAQPLTVDDPRLDMRPSWMPDDDQDDMTMYSDPTDEDMWLGLTSDVQDDNGPRTVNVRPGETLIP